MCIRDRSGGLAALGSRPDSFDQGVSGANQGKAAFTQPEAYGKQLGLAPIEGADNFPGIGTTGNLIKATAAPETSSVSFLEGLKNVGESGLSTAQDFVQGNRQTLADLGQDPSSLFSSANKFQGARDAAKALGLTSSLALSLIHISEPTRPY